MGNITEYELTIVRREVNPAWTLYMNTPQIRMDGYNFTQPPSMPNQFLEQKTLTVVIDDATFAAIRKAALETLR